MQKKCLVLSIVFCVFSFMMVGGCTNMENSLFPRSEKYPEKPIITLVSYSVGSGSDLLARLMEKESTQRLGQPLVIVNKPGGSGMVGWNELATARPDGYTIGISSVELLLNPLYGLAKYDYSTAMEPLAQIATAPLIMAVQAKQPWRNVDEFVRYGQEHPGQIKFGHQGIGSLGHITGELLAQTGNITFEQAPFLSSSELVTALLGGHIQVVFVNPAVVKEHIKDGTIRALAVASGRRLSDDPVFKDVPTFKELGYDIELDNWLGVAAPKELPDPIKRKLAEGLRDIVTDPEFKKNVEQLGFQYDYLGPKEAQEKWLSDSQKFSRIIQTTGILELIKAQTAK